MFGKSYECIGEEEKPDNDNGFGFKREFCQSEGSEQEEKSMFADRGVRLDRYVSQVLNVNIHYSAIFKN